MIELVISGGQTGVDQAGWRAAKSCHIKTTGFMPKGWKTEDGPRPDFKYIFNAKEHDCSDYPRRTVANVLSAEATIWFGRGDSRGFACTEKACLIHKRPLFFIGEDRTASDIAFLLNGFAFKSINIDGNRESITPGIGKRIEKLLICVFKIVNTLD